MRRCGAANCDSYAVPGSFHCFLHGPEYPTGLLDTLEQPEQLRGLAQRVAWAFSNTDGSVCSTLGPKQAGAIRDLKAFLDR